MSSEINGETSDGYHTFNELYAHRIRLWIELCRVRGRVWRARKHSDGSSIEGWFILGMGIRPGTQITYHLPEEFWDECAFVNDTFDLAPEFDGHTSADVLARLAAIDPK